VLNIINIRMLLSRAADRNVPVRTVARETVRWLFPYKKAYRHRLAFSIVSLLFHVAVIFTPIFLGAHIVLVERSLGVSWPAMSQGLADILTVTAVATALILLIQRIAARATRALSRVQDFALPAIIAVPFITGFLAMHPSMNPVPYHTTMFLHVMSANLIFVLIPFTKLSHVVLFPTTQLISELGWHFDPDSGTKVAAALAKENEAI
jgi:nitrate reductase gamma subunit